HDWYTIDQQSFGCLMEFKETSPFNLGCAGGNILGLSACVDPNTGSAEVFTLDYQGVPFPGPDRNFLEACDSNGKCHDVNPDPFSSISAPRDGHVYAATTDGLHVRYFDSKGNGIDLGAPAKGLPSHGEGCLDPGEVAASLNRYGGNEVFVIGQ